MDVRHAASRGGTGVRASSTSSWKARAIAPPAASSRLISADLAAGDARCTSTGARSQQPPDCGVHDATEGVTLGTTRASEAQGYSHYDDREAFTRRRLRTGLRASRRRCPALRPLDVHGSSRPCMRARTTLRRASRGRQTCSAYAWRRCSRIWADLARGFEPVAVRLALHGAAHVMSDLRSLRMLTAWCVSIA
ncbi:hypothetical protein OH77DRAFT_648040 [Trametes cingulata]|nr:hypothetical protein OH77DRAFT_648040 [Trametes cingulata]